MCEVRGRALSVLNRGPSSDSQKMVVLSAREYASKSSQSLDSIIELQIESLQLKNKLESLLLAHGMDPKTHPLLVNQEDPIVEGADDFTESFLFTMRQNPQMINGGLELDGSLDNIITPQSNQAAAPPTINTLSFDHTLNPQSAKSSTTEKKVLFSLFHLLIYSFCF